MVKAKRIVYNAETGEIQEEEFEFTPDESETEMQGIDLLQMVKKISEIETKLEKK